MTHRAQEVLAHRMGMLRKVRSLIDDALKEYIAIFEAPLSQDSIAALSQPFKTECQLTSLVDDALNELGSHCTTNFDGIDTTGSPTATRPLLPHTFSPSSGTLVAAT